MKILPFSKSVEGPKTLDTPRLVLRAPQLMDFEEWAGLRARSADFLRPYEPAWPNDELTRSTYRTWMRRQEADIRAGRALPWFLFARSGPSQGELLGGITLFNIRRGVAQTGTIGYWMGAEFAGHGYMKEALSAVCAVAFGDYKLHRLEAATVLDNIRSQRLLLSCGFHEEGLARAYLKINGNWRDHKTFALLQTDPRPN